MKARIKETGEVVTILNYKLSHYSSALDKVSYIDSKGDYHQANYFDFFDFESVEETTNNDEYWRTLRDQYVGMAMQSLIVNNKAADRTALARQAIGIAIETIRQLKELNS